MHLEKIVGCIAKCVGLSVNYAMFIYFIFSYDILCLSQKTNKERMNEMRKVLKKGLIAVMTAAVLFGSTMAVSGTADANMATAGEAGQSEAPKPSKGKVPKDGELIFKRDFKTTGRYSKEVTKYVYNAKKGGCYIVYAGNSSKAKARKMIKTIRGITLYSTKKQVYKRYGDIDNLRGDASDFINVRKQWKNNKYIYKNVFKKGNYIQGYCSYDENDAIFFFFNKKKEVIAIEFDRGPESTKQQ